jgi:hypothetical protein
VLHSLKGLHALAASILVPAAPHDTQHSTQCLSTTCC